MSTDLVPVDGAPLVVTDAGTAVIERAVAQMEGAYQLAKALANTTFVPAHFRGKPDDCAAAIMYGAAIGLDPMASFRAIFVVGGNPGLYARHMVAIVQAAGHQVWTEETSDEQVTVCGQRRGSEHVERATWTIARAEKAEYVPQIDPDTGEYRVHPKTGKLIGNMKYLTEPENMLYARAAADVCRRVAPDALAGLDTSVEELHVVDGEVVSSTTTTAVTRETAADALKAPAADPPPAPAAEPANTAGGITDAQHRKLGVLFREAEITDVDAARRYCADVIGREIGSRKEMSSAEAGKVIDSLEAEAKADPDTGEITPEANDGHQD